MLKFLGTQEQGSKKLLLSPEIIHVPEVPAAHKAKAGVYLKNGIPCWVFEQLLPEEKRNS